MEEYSLLKLGRIRYTGRSPEAYKLSNLYNLRSIIILEENVTKLLIRHTKIRRYTCIRNYNI